MEPHHDSDFSPSWLWAVLAFALVYPTVLAWAYFVALAGSGREPNPASQAAYTGGKILQFLFPVLYLWTFERRWPRPARPCLRGLIPGLAFGLFVAAVILAAYHLLLRDWLAQIGTPERVRTKLGNFGLDTRLGFLVLGAFLSLPHSLLEEYYWRWFAFGRLAQRIPILAAVVLSSLAFMAHHVVVLAVFLPGYLLTAVVPFSLAIAGGGAVWAWLYHRTGSIYAPWVSHVVVDVTIMLVGYDLAFGHG